MSTYGPKPLIKLEQNETILSRQIAMIGDMFPSCEIILVAGYQGDKVMDYALKHVVKVENTDYKTTNIVRSIGLGLRAATTDNVVIIHGDLVFNKECLKAPYDLDSFAIISQSLKTDEVGCTIEKGIIEHIFYDLPQHWSQIVYLTGRELNMFRKLVWNKDNSHMYHFEILNELIDKGGKLKAIAPKGAVSVDVDTSKDILLAEKVIAL